MVPIGTIFRQPDARHLAGRRWQVLACFGMFFERLAGACPTQNVTKRYTLLALAGACGWRPGWSDNWDKTPGADLPQGFSGACGSARRLRWQAPAAGGKQKWSYRTTRLAVAGGTVTRGTLWDLLVPRQPRHLAARHLPDARHLPGARHLAGGGARGHQKRYPGVPLSSTRFFQFRNL